MSTPRTMRLTPELVALCHRDVKGDPESTDWENFEESDYETAIDLILAQRPPGPVWLFAYGSLIWKPEIETVEKQRGIATGWHRAFSMEIDDYRATPEQPGYMMCLDPGGSCEGMLLRLEEHTLRQQLYALLYREIGTQEQLESVRWTDVQTAEHVVRALVFYAGPARLDYYKAGRALPEIAHGLARACGFWGSGAEYLRNTVAHLEELGIHDENLWQLQELVAQEIEALYGL